jgi:hypothetical protein
MYTDVLIQTYVNSGEASVSSVRARPYPGQKFSTHMNVECSKRMRAEYPVGSIFLVKAKLTDREGGGQFLYTHHSWSFRVLTEDEAQRYLQAHQLR